MVLDGSVKSNDCDEEKENATGNDAADDVEAGDHVRRFAVRRDADQKECDHLQKQAMISLQGMAGC